MSIELQISDDSASTSEKIILACNNIQWANARIAALQTEMRHHKYTMERDEHRSTMDEIITRNESTLQRALSSLAPVLEDLGNYLNDCDAVAQLDIRALRVGNEVVLLGKDEYDIDYEDDKTAG
ncbi:hypothetical protein SAMN04488128_103224 [Chitinophaga eiseniae]|uniref:Uncharacterized protein n=1 Tax=Chitinophaga eiseniae TaxID=634771 RepID=A0A1T4SQG5_9BACT|nr:hypothetical protein [Chitinophaga eiseniae]SKA30111.1 hypothetical protein SAMN04488128_103224 [Chitinophaga eiseniae]